MSAELSRATRSGTCSLISAHTYFTHKIGHVYGDEENFEW